MGKRNRARTKNSGLTILQYTVVTAVFQLIEA
jgi:hypothetical protein